MTIPDLVFASCDCVWTDRLGQNAAETLSGQLLTKPNRTKSAASFSAGATTALYILLS